MDIGHARRMQTDRNLSKLFRLPALISGPFNAHEEDAQVRVNGLGKGGRHEGGRIVRVSDRDMRRSAVGNHQEP